MSAPYGRMAPGDLDDTIGETPRQASEVYNDIIKSDAFKTIVERAVKYAHDQKHQGIGQVFCQDVRRGIIRQLNGQSADDESQV